MKIHVTEDDIKLGARRNVYCCPIALAVKRKPGLTDISVGGECITCYKKGTPIVYKLPQVARTFIRTFDTELTQINPVSFEVRRERKIP